MRSTSGPFESARVVCQIESRQALDNVDAIAAVPGVDALFIGRADLALSMGIDNPRAPEMEHAVQRIVEAARRAGCVCGMHVADAEEAGRFSHRGVSWFVIGSDQSLLLQAARRICRQEKTV